MPGGRPTAYDPSYCAAVIEHCVDGASLTSFAASIGVCRETIANWSKEHPEFLVSVRVTKASACAWWEKQGRTITQNGGGNATLAIFGMKNMGGDDWSDTIRQEHSGTVNHRKLPDDMTDEELLAEIAEAKARRAA